tara:strand:+ start:591 stop:809 length:219 start_codon:yes stop_codon:yes gene_type:complete
MSDLVFAINIKAVLEDDTEVTDVLGMLINNKRVYKLPDNTILTGIKKIKKIKFAKFTVSPTVLPYIMSRENE